MIFLKMLRKVNFLQYFEGKYYWLYKLNLEIYSLSPTKAEFISVPIMMEKVFSFHSDPLIFENVIVGNSQSKL